MSEKREKNKKLFKEIGTVCLILLITLLTYKFIDWNHWKAKQGIAVARAILKAPSAVNLTVTHNIAHKKKTLLKKSFPYNRDGNFYIIDRFNLPQNAESGLEFTVNGEVFPAFSLYSFPQYRIIHVGNIYFVFTEENRDIETLITLSRSMPAIIKALPVSPRDSVESLR